ncbi:beta-aspartyl-peptidase [Virgibacillus halodenitrificans]|uniref:Isoaspartyl dipeptidase n=1 Tax=Virgibacillus halodenitrificans TaxID=1482 RepID=A0AAC9J293_VIRHA|nr:beta-aspartyl-peptidase [Virgibacillus halodenitrificans]APC49354.1 beta-aspartyl-peptidase [Virgibacillus halodenitrificans]MCG1030090.1 beta-aspartyl-peptidase [Virgibacillus halodenitrificans]MEC2158291.1 beta-aspartyl-peptidase [Virgibacillus halodenitrificans]
MFILIKNGKIYAPQYLGKKSILISENKIIKVGDIDEETLYQLGVDIKVIDAAESLIFPGLIDPHVHLIGGGGEGGFATRTPEIQLSEIIKSGITTMVGLLGTDGTTRHMTSLLAKARGLEEEGITTYIYSGNYHVPTPTITSSIKDDVILIDKVIGAGEIAISDSRSAQPSVHELAKLCAEARIGGLLSKKAGVTHFHVGPGKAYLTLLHQIIDEYEIPPTSIYATHITRSKELVDDAIKLSQKGAYVDITADEQTIKWVKYFKENGGRMDRLTISSDGNGSLPKFNEGGELIGFGVASPSTLFEQLKAVVKGDELSLEEIVPLLTSNTAAALRLNEKGIIEQHADADLIVINKQTFDLEHVIAKGRLMMRDKKVVVKGTFE